VAEHRPAQPQKREKRTEDKRREAFDAERKSLLRRRRFVGALAFIPLLGAFGCSVDILPICQQIPGEWWWAAFAAILGSYIGINLRLFLERRKFRRGVASG
jgi:hypothetical protein